MNEYFIRWNNNEKKKKITKNERHANSKNILKNINEYNRNRIF